VIGDSAAQAKEVWSNPGLSACMLKVCAIPVACAFVYVCHEAAQNGRYTLLLNDASDPHMLDTRTGAYYSLRGGKEGA